MDDDTYARLRKLQALKNDGILTEDEFAIEKALLLEKPEPPPPQRPLLIAIKKPDSLRGWAALLLLAALLLGGIAYGAYCILQTLKPLTPMLLSTSAVGTWACTIPGTNYKSKLVLSKDSTWQKWISSDAPDNLDLHKGYDTGGSGSYSIEQTQSGQIDRARWVISLDKEQQLTLLNRDSLRQNNYCTYARQEPRRQ
jgi:hypothetical protein